MLGSGGDGAERGKKKGGEERHRLKKPGWVSGSCALINGMDGMHAHKGCTLRLLSPHAATAGRNDYGRLAGSGKGMSWSSCGTRSAHGPTNFGNCPARRAVRKEHAPIMICRAVMGARIRQPIFAVCVSRWPLVLLPAGWRSQMDRRHFVPAWTRPLRRPEIPKSLDRDPLRGTTSIGH